MVSLPPPDIWIQIMTMNTSMDIEDHPIHSEHIFACIIWILLGVIDIIDWCAAERACVVSSLETIWSISLQVFEYK